MALLHTNLSAGDEPPDYTEPNRCACGVELEADQRWCSAECQHQEHAWMITVLLKGM